MVSPHGGQLGVGFGHECLQTLFEQLVSGLGCSGGLREHWGLPIRITSGYRCPELNEEVGGVEDSYHMDGCAADISAIDPTRNVELMSLIRAMHLVGKLALTECYLGPKAKYIHIALDKDAIDAFPFI